MTIAPLAMPRDRAIKWQEDAIASCRSKPELAAREASGDLCIACMMSHPCFCDRWRTLPRMRKFYEANRRTLFRAEPVLELNWGQKGDGLMNELYDIASAPFRAEIRRLHKELEKQKK